MHWVVTCGAQLLGVPESLCVSAGPHFPEVGMPSAEAMPTWGGGAPGHGLKRLRTCWLCMFLRHVRACVPAWSSQGGLVSSVGVILLLGAGMHARRLYLAEFCEVSSQGDCRLGMFGLQVCRVYSWSQKF